MTEPRVEAGGRALEVLAEIMEMAPIRHTLGLNHTYESGCRCLRCAADSAIESGQSALNRDLNPHKAAIVAMLLWNKNYAQSGRGSMNFFEHYLSESERQICREQVEKILKAPDESRRQS